jgi:hypothetical protein
MASQFPIATIINFCTNDYPFLRHCIDSVKPFSDQIFIPVCDHFFDAVKEDRMTLDRIYAESSDVQFFEFPFDEKKSLYGSHSSIFWHNLARMIGRFFLNEKIKYVLFLDCDEIVDSKKFVEWMHLFPYHEYDAMNICNYWYFRESHLQAKSWEHTPLLVKKDLLDGNRLMNPWERGGIYALISGNKASEVLGLDAAPMIHHYSWVKTKEQSLRKVLSWGHRRDRDWISLVEEEFSRPFRGTDFVHGYEFVHVPPFKVIDLLKKPEASTDIDFSHVRHLTHEEVIKIDVSLTYQIPLWI